MEQKVNIIDMSFYSETFPELPIFVINRKNELDFYESQLVNNSVICMKGESGVGISTALALFAKKYPHNCVSYFNNGLEKMRLDPLVIERSIISQLYYYLYHSREDFDSSKADYCEISTIYSNVLRKIRQSAKPLYFIFDGFDKVPKESLDNLQSTFAKLFWESAKFIFSGSSENIKQLLPLKVKCTQSNQLLCFNETDVNRFFCNVSQTINNQDLNSLYQITRGNARRMDIVRLKYAQTLSFDQFLKSDITGENELYDYDFHRLQDAESDKVLDFLALLAFAEFRLNKEIICKILSIDVYCYEDIDTFCHEYIENKDGSVSIHSDGFHKYLKLKLHYLRQKIELCILKVLENPSYTATYNSYMPSLYKSLNEPDKLIRFLSRENIQQILIEKKSQAVLNEQCDYGFDACSSDLNTHLSNSFRFALNRCSSREIEKNELWDYEIEALLSVEQYEQALALAQSVYLVEEKLKSLLLIARKRNILPISLYDTIKNNINILVDAIDFEHIPSKAVELAKLLLPINFTSAIAIIDRVANKEKDPLSVDRLYTLISLSTNLEKVEGMGDITNFDVVSARIQNDDLRKIAHAAKNLFSDVSVDFFLQELDKLQNDTQRLHLLQLWIPEHRLKENIGRAALYGIKLVVTVSDSEMPKATLLNTFCQVFHYMSSEEIKESLEFINSMGETIQTPTIDYVDLELTIIEALKDHNPKEGLGRLENLYLYILDLKDKSIMVTCKSKILGRFDVIGVKKDIEYAIGASFDLRKDIEASIIDLLSNTAYHLKVVEGPIKALVCNYPSIIDSMISKMNTKERMSKAYSFASIQYILQIEPLKIDFDFIFSLIAKANYVLSDQLRPLELLAKRICYSGELETNNTLLNIKRKYSCFDTIENPADKCLVLMYLFEWVCKNFPADSYVSKLKSDILTSWNQIEVPWLKIEVGFYLAKYFARVSKKDAEQMIKSCNELKDMTLLASSSCITSYVECIDLYSRSLGKLIRAGLCDDEKLTLFKEDIEQLHSESEAAIIWGKISLEYLLANNSDMFYSICNKYFPISYSGYSKTDQKRIIYNLSPALFKFGQDRFFELLNQYDESFCNDCIDITCRFTICKHPFLADTTIEDKAYELSYNDCEDLLLLLEHSTDDGCFYNIIRAISRSLKEGNIKKLLSTQQKTRIISKAEQIIKKRLPTPSGIQHDGYKIACLAAIKNSNSDFNTRDITSWKSQMDGIKNAADRSFLYFILAPYWQKQADKISLFKDGVTIADTIDATYDKVNRLDLSINECLDYNLKTLIPSIANNAIQSLSIGGSVDDYKRIIDAVYQYGSTRISMS